MIMLWDKVNIMTLVKCYPDINGMLKKKFNFYLDMEI